MDPGLTPVVPSFDGPASSEPVHELRSMETLECYKLVARLGRGGMAEMLLAAWEVEPFVHRPVVVKRLYQHFEEDPRLVQMFLDEALLLCQLDHPHIVKTFEAGVIDGQCCIAMEYLEGAPLQVVLRRAYERGRLQLELGAYIVIGMLEGLHHAHDAKDESGRRLEVVHRDVSPQNVFVTSSGGVKILDFGIAKAATQAARTATGMVKGKVGYMAPEQATAGSVDRRADVWSAGVVLWEAVTGNRLFKADTDAAAINLTLSGDIPSASTLRSEVPAELDAIISRALQRDPAERYASAFEMQRDLEDWLSGAGHAKSPVGLTAFMQQAFATELLEQRLLVASQMARSDCTPPSIPSVADEPTAKIARTWATPEWESQRPPPISSAPPPPIRPSSSRYTMPLVFAALFASAGVASFGIARLLEQSGFEAKASPAREPVPTLTDVSEPKRPEAASASSAGGGAAVEPPAEAAVGILGKAGSDIEFEFAPKQSRQPLRNPARAPLPAPHSADRRSVSPSPDPAGQLAPRGEAAEAFGFLTIDTTPWSFVSMGGKPLGQTPLVGVKLPVGVHVLSLKSPDTGRETSYTVNIEPAKTVARRVGLE